MVNRFEIVGVVELTGISPIQGPCRNRSSGYKLRTGSTTFSDYLRVTLSLKLANFAISSPPPPAKMARGGDVPNFDNCVTIRRIENIYGIVRID